MAKANPRTIHAIKVLDALDNALNAVDSYVNTGKRLNDSEGVDFIYEHLRHTMNSICVIHNIHWER